jgi:hypothetical protein
MPAQTTPAAIEALTRLDVAVDTLLTASLQLHGSGLVTEAQTAAIHHLLDLLDPDTLNAMRVAAGLDTATWPRNERPYQAAPQFPRCAVCHEPISEGYGTHHLTCGLTDDSKVVARTEAAREVLGR